MKRQGTVRGIEATAAGVICLGLAACGGSSGFEAQRESSYSLSSIGSSLGNLVAFNKLFPTETPMAQTEGPVPCPIIEVRDGTASVRVYNGAGQANESVRYGFSLGDIARECSKTGDQLTLKVGAEGRVLIGPVGSPGTFSVPIRVAVRNDSTQKIVSSQVARISATVPTGETGAGFTYVTQPFAVPMVAHPDEDYTILVGFDPGGNAGPDSGERRKKRRS